MSESHSHPPTPQEESEAKLLAYIDGELDEAGRAEIERHLESNPNHRRLLDELKVGRDLLRWVPRETAPPELMESFQSQLERAVLLEEGEDEAAEEAGSLRINHWTQFRAVAAVLLLAVMLGLVVYYALPRPQNRPVVINSPGPATREAEADGAGATPMSPPLVAEEGSLERAELAPARPEGRDRIMGKAGPGDSDGDAKPAGPGPTDLAHRGKVGPAVADAAVPPLADNARDTAGQDAAKPGTAVASALDPVGYLTQNADVFMSNTARNLAQVEAVQVAIDRNSVARSRAPRAAKAGPDTGGYADPLYVVVNTTDPDKTRDQIHAYLSLNGIRNVETLDQTVAALRAQDQVAANVYSQGQAAQRLADAPADQPGGLSARAGAEAKVQQESMKAKGDAGVARSPAAQEKNETEGSRDESGLAGRGGGPSRDESPPTRDAAAKPGPRTGPAEAPAAPEAVAQLRVTEQYDQQTLQKRTDPAAAVMPEAQQQLEQQQQQLVFSDDVQRIEKMMVARGMNRKQALAMQQDLNRPTQAQWAGVYEQPVELRGGARGGQRYQNPTGNNYGGGGGGAGSTAGNGAAPNAAANPAGNAAQQQASPPAAAAPAMPAAPAGTPAPDQAPPAQRSYPQGARPGGAPTTEQPLPRQPTPPAPRPDGGERPRNPAPAPGPSQVPATRPVDLRQGGTLDRQDWAPMRRTDGPADRSRGSATRPATPPAPGGSNPGYGQRSAPSVPASAARPGTQPVAKPSAVAGREAVGTATPRAADPSRERLRQGEQTVAGQPTTRPTATPPLEPAAEQAMPPVAQRPDAGAADEDLPLDVVIVLQRAPLPGAQNAGQQNSQADQLRAPANAAPATSPAAPPPAAR